MSKARSRNSQGQGDCSQEGWNTLSHTLTCDDPAPGGAVPSAAPGVAVVVEAVRLVVVVVD